MPITMISNMIKISSIFSILLITGCSTTSPTEVPKPVVIPQPVQIPFSDYYFEPCPVPEPLTGSITNGELLENYAALKNQIACLQTRLDALKKENERVK